MVRAIDEPIGSLLSAEAVVNEVRGRNENSTLDCRPLWLTQGEAESLLMLCVASPIAAGASEHELFMKLGDLYRSYRG
jgi:hypothetical protein